MSDLTKPAQSPLRHDTWWIVLCYMVAIGIVVVTLFFSLYQSFTMAQFGSSLAVLVVIVVLLRWLRADRRGFALAIALTAIGSFIVLYWANSQVTLLADLDSVSKRLCHVQPGGLVSVTVYTENATPIAYARSHDSKGISDSYYTEYFDQQGKLVCTQSAFSTEAENKCAVMMKGQTPSVDIVTAAQREVCGNFPI